MDERIKKILKNPSRLFLTLGHREFLNWIDDKTYLKIAYRICMKKKLNLDNPKTFNEKLQWLKLYDRKSIYSEFVDKYEVRKHIASIIGEEYLIPCLGVWDSFDEIDFEQLPNQFVIKCTHDSGGILICRDKLELNKKMARKKIERCLRHNFFWGQREWPYKNISPRIIIEPYMEDTKTRELRDYKFFAFDGDVKALFIATERGSSKETKFDFFDADFNHLSFENGHPNAEVTPEKPLHFEKMKQLVVQLSKGFPQVRVDLYECNGRIFFGEMTFFHWSGFTPFEPEQWDYKFGEWIILPEKTYRTR